MDFPKASDFKDFEELTKWKDLHLGWVYRVDMINDVMTRYGKSAIVTLTDHNDEKCRSFLPGSVKKKLESLPLPLYIKNNGLKQSLTDTSKHYYSINILTIDDQL